MKKIITIAASAALLASATAFAFPDRPIKVVVPWAAGGDTDNIFRPFAPALQKQLGQTVVIANVGGASGTKGAKEAKDAPPDGYTLFVAHEFIHSTYYTGVADIQYSDFEPICMIASTPSVLTASPKTPWKDAKELIPDAKARPGQITVGATLASTSHFFPALVEKAAGIKFKYVSYDGLAPRMNAILGGHIDLTDSNLTQKGKVDAGQLKFLAIATEKTASGTAECAYVEGTGRQRGVRRQPRSHGAQRHARRGARQTRVLVRAGGQRPGIRRIDEATGHGRPLP